MYELNELEDLENFLRATNRYFNKLTTKREIDILSIKYIKQLYRSTPDEQTKVLNDFFLELERLENNPATQGDVGIDEMYFWVKSKLQKKSIVELIRSERKMANS